MLINKKIKYTLFCAYTHSVLAAKNKSKTLIKKDLWFELKREKKQQLPLKVNFSWKINFSREQKRRAIKFLKSALKSVKIKKRKSQKNNKEP